MSDDRVPQILWFLITGNGLFIGALLFALAASVIILKMNRWTKVLAYFLILSGIVITFLSSTPFPVYAYVP